MAAKTPIDDIILEAIQTVRNFITETTGAEPSSGEIARALKRYFVLSEIKAHILMERES